MSRSSADRGIALVVLSMIFVGCASNPKAVPSPDTGVIKIPVIVAPKLRKQIPEGSRIFVAGVSGQECAEEVKDALMRRLIDNADYEVLSRDNLDQILAETERGWAGSFNSQTSVRLGELVGASLFIVGRVGYCGIAANDSIDGKVEGSFTVQAALQLIDIETGTVILSSSAEGHYIPRPLPLALANGVFEPPSDPEATGDERRRRTGWRRLAIPFAWLGRQIASFWHGLQERSAAEDKDLAPEPKSLLQVRAAEDMANGFADKFFARPTWETVEMWDNARWAYGSAIHYVKLGYCSKAVGFLESAAAREVPFMSEREAGEYLHNYGVALLCANQSDRALDKLRAAYRVGYSQSTLKMVGLASRIEEWDLDVAVNTEPVVEMLFERGVVSNDDWGKRAPAEVGPGVPRFE